MPLAHSGFAKPEVKTHLAQFHHVAMIQRLTPNAPPVHPGSVGGIEIADLKRAIGQMINFGMMAGNRIVVEAKIVIRHPT